MREGGIWDIDELIDFTLTYWGVLLNWFQLLLNYWLKSNEILETFFFCNFTFYCCLINNLHTLCSCLHNNYKCIQFDHAKEFFFFSFSHTIYQQCGTIYVINKKHKKKTSSSTDISPLPFVFIISFMKKIPFSCHFSFSTTFPLIFMLGFSKMGWHLTWVASFTSSPSNI